MGRLIINDNIYNNIQNILNNYNDLPNKFNLSKNDISSVLNAKGKINYIKTSNLRELYNFYYNTNLNFEDMYNTSFIKDYIMNQNKNQAIYGNEKGTSFIDKFLSITRFIEKRISNTIKNINENYIVLVKDKKMIIILLMIVLFVLIILKSYNLFFEDTSISNIDLGREQQFINK